MPILYILCGIAASGKTTWATNFIVKNWEQDIRYVSRDDIRFSLVKEDESYFSHEKQVFKKFVNTIAATLIDGFDVIADATHLNIFSRKKLTNAIDKIYSDYQIIYVVFDIPFDTIKYRNNFREGRRKVSDEALENMFKNFNPPHHEDTREVDCYLIKE